MNKKHNENINLLGVLQIQYFLRTLINYYVYVYICVCIAMFVYNLKYSIGNAFGQFSFLGIRVTDFNDTTSP